MAHDAAKLRRIEEARSHHNYPSQRQTEALMAWRFQLPRVADKVKRARLLAQMNQLESKLGVPLTSEV